MAIQRMRASMSLDGQRDDGQRDGWTCPLGETVAWNFERREVVLGDSQTRSCLAYEPSWEVSSVGEIGMNENLGNNGPCYVDFGGDCQKIKLCVGVREV
jgi:hypothetical protein